MGGIRRMMQPHYATTRWNGCVKALRHKGCGRSWILLRYRCCMLLGRSMSWLIKQASRKWMSKRSSDVTYYTDTFVVFHSLIFFYPQQPWIVVNSSHYLPCHLVRVLTFTRQDAFECGVVGLEGETVKLNLWAESQASQCTDPAPHWPARISCSEVLSIFTRTNWNSDRRWNILVLLSVSLGLMCVSTCNSLILFITPRCHELFLAGKHVFTKLS